MKKTLGTVALMMVSAAAFVMPAAAKDRDSRDNDYRRPVVSRDYRDRRAPVRTYDRDADRYARSNYCR